MYEYTIHSNGNILKLSGQENKWQIRSVSGLNPPATTYSRASIVGVPGIKKTGATTSARNIVFTLKVNNPCEKNRAELLNFLSTNTELTLHIKTGNKELNINGWVETNEYEIYSQSQTMQVSILCEHPYFKSSDDRTTSYVNSTGGLQFPLQVNYYDVFICDRLSLIDRHVLYNYGQVTTGLNIELEVYQNTSNIKVYNIDNPNEFFGLKGDFLIGDRILIDTNDLAKDKVVLIRNGVKTKILNRLMSGVTWFKIANILVLGVEGYIFMTITNHDEIKGI